MDSHPLIDIIAVGLVSAFIFGILANRLRISPLVGYLIAGVVVGPYTPGFVADKHVAAELAEIGVILLMFGVGLHFSFKDLLSVKSVAVPGAIAQIAFATLLGWGLSAILGWGTITGIIFGLCLSTASTVVLLRSLEEHQLIETQRGKIAIGWLIVEDMAMVLTLVLLPPLVSAFETGNANAGDIAINLAMTIGKVLLFVIIMLFGGSKLVPWLLARSAATGSRELFTLAVLAIAMGIAFGAVTLFGVSFALGAFFAGMVLNESELSHRAAHDTLPLRDAFAVLFFVSVGMLFDPKIVITHPFALIATVSIIIFGKSLAAYVLVRLMKHTNRTALLISASLAQIGEFAFILATLGGKLQVLSPELHSLIVAGAIISILLNPIIFNLVERYLKQTETPEEIIEEEIIEEEIQVPFVIIDSSLKRVEASREQHFATVLGNAANHEILQLARLDCASGLLITIPNSYEVGEIIAYARTQRPELEIVVRAHYEAEIDYIIEQGTTLVVTGEKEIANSMLDILNLDNVTPESLNKECPI